MVVLKEFGELGFEGGRFGDVADLDVGVVGVLLGVVLVVGFAVEEFQERYELGNDGLGEVLADLKLRDIGGGDLLLLWSGVEDDGAVAGTCLLYTSPSP